MRLACQVAETIASHGRNEFTLTVLRGVGAWSGAGGVTVSAGEKLALRDRASSIVAAQQAEEGTAGLFRGYCSRHSKAIGSSGGSAAVGGGIAGAGALVEGVDKAAFVRMARECHLLSKKLTPTDVELVFEKVKVGKKKTDLVRSCQPAYQSELLCMFFPVQCPFACVNEIRFFFVCAYAK